MNHENIVFLQRVRFQIRIDCPAGVVDGQHVEAELVAELDVRDRMVHIGACRRQT